MSSTDSLQWRREFQRLDGAYSPATMRSYYSDVEAFEAWCVKRDIVPFPASVPRVSDFARNVELEYDHKRVGYDEATLKSLLESCGLISTYSEQYMKFFGRLAWSVDRKIRNRKLLRVSLFWPLYALASLDYVMPYDSSAGGLFMVFKKTEPLG